MDEDPVGEIRRRAGYPMQRDETVKEYVRRVGAEEGLPEPVVDGAVEYVTQWQYARSPPSADDDFRMFLFQLGDGDTESVAPGGEGSSEAVDGRGVVERPDVEPVPELQPLRAERRDARTDFKGGLRGSEPRRLLARFAVLLVVAPVVGWMMARTWVPGNAPYDAVEGALGAAFGLSGAAALELVGSFGLGLYAVLLVLFVVDVKKRVQGMLLLLASGLALGVLAVQGVFLPNVSFTAPLNVLGAAMGVAVGLLVESEQVWALDRAESTLRRPALDTGEVPEFRYAVLVTFGLAAAAVVVTLVAAVAAGVVRVYDPVASVVFVAVTYRFVGYDSETTYVTLGPARAGKSMLMLGLCLELLDADGPHPDPNDYLQNSLERVSNLRAGEERWPIPSTPPDELRVSSFEVVAGYYFPQRLQLTALDYAGQHLERVADLLASRAGGDDGVPGEVAEWIRDSDTLVVLLDVERLVYPEKFRGADDPDGATISWGLEHYATILDHRDPEDVVVVATKCDILVDQYLVDAPSTYGSFAAFREAVTDHLRERADVDELLRSTGESTIHPVYYATRRRDGEYVPRLDENDDLMPVGFGHLIAELRRRQ